MARRSRPEQKAAKGRSVKTRTGSVDWLTRHTVKVGGLGRGGVKLKHEVFFFARR